MDAAEPLAEDPEMIQAGPEDTPQLGRTLALAFRDDPVQRWLFPTEAEWRHGSERLFRATLHCWSRIGHVLTNAARTGAAIWVPPGPPRPTRWASLRMGALGVYALRGRAGRAGRSFARVERRHPHEPHWYLMALGTDPAHQRQGIGSQLLRPVLARCDREGVPAWLESSKQRNVPYYEGHGFELVEEVQLLEDGPPLWLMLRRPAGAP